MNTTNYLLKTILIFILSIISLNGIAHLSNSFVPVVQDGIEQLKQQAKAGNIQSQYRLGMACEEGKNITKSYTEAAKWFKKAADAGHVPSLLRLAYYYEVGAFTDQNYKEAARLYTLAAQTANPQAMNALGVYYAEGLGVKRDLKLAKELFLCALDKGEPKAQANLDKLNKVLASDTKKTVQVKKNAVAKTEKKNTAKSNINQSVRENNGTPMGIIDDDDLAAAGVNIENQSNYPGTISKSLYEKMLDKRGKLTDGWMSFGIILICIILFVTYKIIGNSQVSFQGPLTIIISLLFLGTVRGYFANINLFGDWASCVLFICIVVGIVQCYRKSDGIYKIWSAVISLAVGIVAYHTALILFYASGWFMGAIFVFIITALFLVLVLKFDLRGTSSGRGGGSSSSSGAENQSSESGICCYYEHGHCSRIDHMEGIHNGKCSSNGHNYLECSDFKE